MKEFLFALGISGLLGCSAKNDQKASNSLNLLDSSQTQHSSLLHVDCLYKNEISHHFSSSTEKDLFRIFVTGKSIKDGQARFQIISNVGKMLLDEPFPAEMLIGYGFDIANPTVSEQEIYIKRRMDEFFKEGNFRQPAISSEDTFDGDYSEKESWQDIKSDREAIGFYYLLGEESGTSIAYSKVKGKVVTYFNCC